LRDKILTQKIGHTTASFESFRKTPDDYFSFYFPCFWCSFISERNNDQKWKWYLPDKGFNLLPVWFLLKPPQGYIFQMT